MPGTRKMPEARISFGCCRHNKTEGTSNHTSIVVGHGTVISGKAKRGSSSLLASGSGEGSETETTVLAREDRGARGARGFGGEGVDGAVVSFLAFFVFGWVVSVFLVASTGGRSTVRGGRGVAVRLRFLGSTRVTLSSSSGSVDANATWCGWIVSSVSWVVSDLHSTTISADVSS